MSASMQISSSPSQLSTQMNTNNSSNTTVQQPSQQPQLQYLFDDSDSVIKGMPFGTRLCYGTGTSYLMGLALGGTYGFIKGLADPRGVASSRLRVNCIMNACANHGPLIANSFGLLALGYNLVHGGLIWSRQGKEDMAGSLGSAFVSGSLVRAASLASSTGGAALVKSSGLTGVAMASLVFAYKTITSTDSTY